MTNQHSHIAPADLSPTRLSDYAHIAFPEIGSRKGGKKAVKKGELILNGKPGHSGDWVKPGFQIEWQPTDKLPIKIFENPLEIVYEDDHVAIVLKPGGIPVSGNQYKTLQNALPYNLSKSEEKDALVLPRPAHRIDSATNGLVLIGKTKSALINLGQQFAGKTIKKRYRALVSGKLDGEGTIQIPIENKEALTRYSIVKTVNAIHTRHLSLVDLYPETGRTHQLRIHLATIGHPIHGDRLYGTEGKTYTGKGLFLSAVELTFTHPYTGKEQTVSHPEPNKFKIILERENKRFLAIQEKPSENKQ